MPQFSGEWSKAARQSLPQRVLQKCRLSLTLSLPFSRKYSFSLESNITKKNVMKRKQSHYREEMDKLYIPWPSYWEVGSLY